MKPSTQRLIIILGSFVFLVGTVYVALSFVYPSFLSIQELRAERQNRIDTRREQEDAEKKISELTKQYEQLAITQDVFSSMLPMGPDTPSLLNQFQGIARNNGLRLNTLSFQYLPVKSDAKALVKTVGIIRVAMSMHGSYENLKNFVSEIETNVRLLDVYSLRIDGGAIPRKDTFDYSITADAYYQLEK